MSCYSPFHVDIPGRIESVPVPCGRCPYCLKRRVSEWSFRLRKQDEISVCSFFVTLTYSEPPISPKGFMTLNKVCTQRFFKRLRKATPQTTWKYYLVGEYGSQNWRPHYHIILFADTQWSKDQLLIQLYKSWDKGVIDVGTVTGASVAYTLKYVQKPKRVPAHKNDDRLPEFSLMSKGLGINYLTQNIVDYHASNLSENYAVQDGYKVPLPRYYRDRILTPDQKLQQRKIIRSVTTERENRRFENFITAHPGALQVDYETYKNESRLSAYRSFFKNQSIRKL